MKKANEGVNKSVNLSRTMSLWCFKLKAIKRFSMIITLSLFIYLSKKTLE